MKKLSKIFFLFTLIIFSQAKAQVVINEISQGLASSGNGKAEYVELVVVGTPTCVSTYCADIRGWVVDDNNGSHGVQGITPGCIRFANIPEWECIKPGSIIVIYNNLNRNSKIPPDDSLDSNNDFVYILSSSSTLLEKHTSVPNSGSSAYPTSGFTNSNAFGSDDVMIFNNSEDCCQIINPITNSQYQAIGWGSTVINYNVFAGGNMQDKVLYVKNYQNKNDPFVQNNWAGGAAGVDETPGLPNTPNDAIYINKLRTINQAYVPLGANLSVTQPSCNGVCDGVINVAGTNSYGNYTYTWNTTPVSYTSTVSNLCSGTYKVTIKDASDCKLDTIITLADSSFNINVSPANPNICSGQAQLLTASGASNYSWMPNTAISSTVGNSVTIRPTSNIQYTLIGSTGGCVDSLIINVNTLPYPNLLTDTLIEICKGSSKIIQATGAQSYTWLSDAGVLSTSSSSVQVTPLASTNYTVIGYLGSCADTAFVNAQVYNIPIVSVNGLTSICSGDNVALSASGASNFSWQPVNGLSDPFIGNPQASPISSTNYTVVGYNGICSDTAYLNINVSPSPDLQFTGDTVFCSGEQSVFYANGANTYNWQPGIGLSSQSDSIVTASPTQSIIYTLIGNISNCADTLIFKTYVSEKANVSVQDINYCEGFSGNLNAIGASTYSWFPSLGLNNTAINNPVCNVGLTTVYTVIGLNDCPNTEDTAFANVTVNLKPQIDIFSSVTSGCLPLTVNFNSTTINQVECLWIFNNTITSSAFSNTQTFNQGNAVNVSFWVKDSFGCENDTVLFNYIDLYQAPISDFNYNPESPISILNPEITFNNLSQNATSYLWYFNENETSTVESPYYTVIDTGTYQITLISFNGTCSDTIVKPIKVIDETMVYIPNSFTPNDDLLNDVFQPVIRGFKKESFNIKIYDRWGNLINNNSDYFKGWDGKNKGKNVPVDLYAYKLTFIDVLGNQRDYNGTFSLIR